MQVLEACPNARLVTNFVGLGRMTEEFDLPVRRVYFVNDGETFSAGDRTLAAIRPPYYDSPATRGLWDASTGVYFAADAFGAVVPGECEYVADVDADVYTTGFNWFNRGNSPWHEVTDPAKVNAVVDRIRRLEPHVIVSAHGPSALDSSDKLCAMLADIATMDPLVLPNQAEFEQMLTAMEATEPPVAPPGRKQDFLDHLGNNGWARNNQTDALMPEVLGDCEEAGLTVARVKGRHDVHWLRQTCPPPLDGGSRSASQEIRPLSSTKLVTSRHPMRPKGDRRILRG